MALMLEQLSALIIYAYPIATAVMLLLVLLTPVLNKLPQYEWQQINKGFFYIAAAISVFQIILSTIWLSRYAIIGDTSFIGNPDSSTAAFFLDAYSVSAILIISIAFLISSIMTGAMRLHGTVVRIISILTVAVASCLVFLVISINIYFTLTVWIVTIMLVLMIIYLLHSKNLLVVIYSSVFALLCILLGVIAFVNIAKVLHSTNDLQTLWINSMDKTASMSVVFVCLGFVIIILSVLTPFLNMLNDAQNEEEFSLKIPALIMVIIGITLLFMRIAAFSMPAIIPLSYISGSSLSFLGPVIKLFIVSAIIISAAIILLNICIYLEKFNILKFFDISKPIFPYALTNMAVSVIYLFVLSAFLTVINGGRDFSSPVIIGTILFMAAFSAMIPILNFAPIEHKYIDIEILQKIVHASYIAALIYPVTGGLVMVAKINIGLFTAGLFTPFIWLLVIFVFLTSFINTGMLVLSRETIKESKSGIGWSILSYSSGLIIFLGVIFMPFLNSDFLKAISMSIYSAI